MTEIQQTALDSFYATNFINQAWAKFNLKNGYVVKSRFHGLINELIDLGELSKELRQPDYIVQSTCGQ